MANKTTPNAAIDKAIDIVGIKVLAEELGITYQAIQGWRQRNRMPDSEYSCRSSHAVKIQALTYGKVTVSMLLGHVPTCVAQQAKKAKKARKA